MQIKRTSYLSELEYKFCIALNCKSYPTFEGSPFYNSILDFLEIFYDKTDVIEDIRPYLKLLQPEDAYTLRDKIDSKVENLEA
jgi:hypothetical protein